MADVRISQLDALRDVGDDDILIVNDKSDGNKTKITRKKDLLHGISRNITDDGLNAVINQDLIVNNDILLDGDIRTTGSITFGMLKDYTEGVSVLGFINDAQSILTLDSVLPTAKAVREYVGNTLTSVNFVDSDRVVSAINYASDILNQLISINDNEITILNEKTIQLRSELEIIDSDYILSATASARSQLRTEIQQEGDRITVLSQDIVTLNSTLTNQASDIAANASANSTLETRIDQEGDRISVVAQDIVTLNSTLTNQASDIVANGTAVSGLSTRIDQEGDRISVVSQDVTTLTANYNNLSNGIAANGTAVSNLSTRVDQEGDRITVVSQDLTTLTSTVNNLDTSANGTAISNLETRIDQEGDRITVVSQDVTTLSSSVNGQIATINQELTTIANDLGGVSAVYALNLDVNNHIAGIRLENDGSTADFVITADTFKIVNASNTAVTPFAIDGSNIALNGNVTINGTLSATQLVGDVAEIYSFSRGSGAGGGTVGSAGLTVETQEIYIPPPTGGVSKRPFIDGRIILSPYSSAQYQNYVVEIKYISGPTFETTLTGFLGGIPSEFSGRRNYARYSGNYTDRVVSGGMLYTASDDARSFYGANYDVTTNETLFLYDDDDGPIGNNATWMLAPSSATSTSYLNKVGATSGGGTGENARIYDVVIPFSGVLPSTTAPQGITLAITWKILGYAGSTLGYLRSLEATYGYQR